MTTTNANIKRRESSDKATLLAGLITRQWGLHQDTSGDYTDASYGLGGVARNKGSLYAKDESGNLHEFIERKVLNDLIASAITEFAQDINEGGVFVPLAGDVDITDVKTFELIRQNLNGYKIDYSVISNDFFIGFNCYNAGGIIRSFAAGLCSYFILSAEGGIAVASGTAVAQDEAVSFTVNSLFNKVLVDGDDYSNADDELVSAGYLESANGPLRRLAEDLLDPTGFVLNGTDERVHTMSIDDGTRTFSIDPTGVDYDIYIKALKFTISTTQSVVFDATEGSKFFYFINNAGSPQLLVSNTFSPELITEYCYVANAYWDATNSKAIILGWEDHGMLMSSKTHSYLHNTRGSAYQEGFSASVTVDASGDLDSSAQVSVTDGKFWDEDIPFNIQNSTPQTISGPGAFPVYYRDGASGAIRKATATNAPVLNFSGGSGLLAFNENVGGTWQQTEVGNGNFVLAHLFVTNNKSEPIIAIQGQNEYSTISNARAGATTEARNLELQGLAVQEYVLIATVIYQTSTSYTNTWKARVRSTGDGDYVDWRETPAGIGAPSATEHNALLGRDTASAHPATAVSITQTGNYLNSTDVQGAIDELNAPQGDHSQHGNTVTPTLGNSLRKLGKIITADASKNFMNEMVESPAVWFDDADGYFHMVFTGYGNGTGQTQASPCHAKSKSIASGWTVDASPLLTGTGTPGDPDEYGGTGPYIVKHDGLYYLFYIGLTAAGYEAGTKTLCLATSPSISSPTWTRYGTIIDLGTAGTDSEWRDVAIWHPSIVKRGALWYLFFNASGVIGGLDRERIGYATSPDLINWTVDDVNSPLVTDDPGGWHDIITGDPSVYRQGEFWFMQFFGVDSFYGYDGLAYTTDAEFPLNWRVTEYSPTLYPTTSGNIDDLFAHKPFVFFNSGIKYHFYTSVSGKKITRDISLAVDNADVSEKHYAGVPLIKEITTPNEGYALYRFTPDDGTGPVFEIIHDANQGFLKIERANANGLTAKELFRIDGSTTDAEVESKVNFLSANIDTTNLTSTNVTTDDALALTLQATQKTTVNTGYSLRVGDDIAMATATGRAKVVVGNTSGKSEVIAGSSSSLGLLLSYDSVTNQGALETYGASDPISVISSDTKFFNGSKRIGYFEHADYEDNAGIQTLTTGGTPYYLTNDGAGSNTYTSALRVSSALWDTTNNRINIDSTWLDDTISIRFNCGVELVSANDRIQMWLVFFNSSDVELFTIPILDDLQKTGATIESKMIHSEFYCGPAILGGYVKLRATASTSSAEISNKGIFVKRDVF